jgi:predicted permease
MTGYLKERSDARADRWGVAVVRSARIPAPMAAPVLGFVGMLAILTGLVLTIACSNVAGMLLARGLDRRREIATRVALGASRRRLLAQLLTEGLALAIAAGALSVPLTSLLVGLLVASQPSLPVPLALELRVDARVHAVAFALAGLAAVAFALLPALQTTRVDVAPALHGATASADRRRAWLRQALVGGQVALAVLLLVAAGLFLRSLQEAARTDVGFTVEAVDTVQIDTAIAGYRTAGEGVRAVDALMERFRALPGVSGVAASRMVPLQGGRLGLGALRAPGSVGPDGTDRVAADWDVVPDGYFETLQIPIVAGRPFDRRDRAGAAWAAVVNQTLASRLWPGQDPIGRTLVQESLEGPRTLEIVGVARDAKHRSLSDDRVNFIYVPLAQQFMSNVTIYVRRQPGASRAQDLRTAVVAFDPMLPVIHMETLEAATALGLLPQRLAAWIASGVGAIGLFLAALGLYGLTAFSIAQRRREFAIRLAVGAPPSAVVRLALRQSVTLTLLGAAAGGGLAAAAASLLGSFLVGVQPIDPAAFALALLLLGAVMIVSAWVPARRAALTDPIRTLRVD